MRKIILVEEKKKKESRNKLIIGLVLVGCFTQVSFADKMINASKDSYLPVKLGGLWIKDHSVPSDGVMTAYFHYLLANPAYQSKGIGKTLVDKILTKYEDYARKVVIAYNKEIGFYKRCGFKVGDNASPMFITYLTT